MRNLVALAAALALTGCASAAMNRGLDHGRRYVWLKDGAGEVERNRAMILCAEANNQRLADVLAVSAIPFVGLAALPATLPAEQAALDERVACMEGDGWRLVDVVSGQPQRVTFSLGAATIVPR